MSEVRRAAHDEPAARIGCVSDTHGFVDPRVFTLLAGVDRVLHAGDVGEHGVLVELAAIAPVVAVRGNVDDTRLPEWVVEDVAGVRVGVTHVALESAGRLLPAVAARVEQERLDLLLFGHTHTAWEGRHGRARLLNPGAAGKPRFRDRPSVAIVTIARSALVAVEIIPLDR